MIRFVLALMLLFTLSAARAEEGLTVAVATNFLTTATEIAAAFETQSGHRVRLVGGATGKLYAQMAQGAPFDVFLSADSATATRIGQDSLGDAASRFTYAYGRLALLAADPAALAGGDIKAALEAASLRHLAMANPQLAPYGVAAMQVLDEFALTESLKDRFVLGQNVGQAFALVQTGAAGLAFVAYSSVIDLPAERFVLVPEGMHAPIRQDAILLSQGEGKAVATGFMAFLKGPEAAAIMRKHGYDPGP
jgi:molybdate transport system substrate-binding protein